MILTYMLNSIHFHRRAYPGLFVVFHFVVFRRHQTIKLLYHADNVINTKQSVLECVINLKYIYHMYVDWITIKMWRYTVVSECAFNYKGGGVLGSTKPAVLNRGGGYPLGREFEDFQWGIEQWPIFKTIYDIFKLYLG